jgi:hypothetical protein
MNSHINILEGIMFAAVSIVVAIFALPTPGYAACTNHGRSAETGGSLCIDHKMCVCQSNSDFDCVGKPACHHEDNHAPPTTLIILNTDQKIAIHSPKKPIRQTYSIAQGMNDK